MILQKILIAICLSLLIGCASVVRSDIVSSNVSSNVTIFHKMPPVYSSKTIAVLPFEKSLESSLEFQAYKNLIEVELQKKGFKVTNNKAIADYMAFITYGINSGQTTTESVPQYGKTGGGTNYSSGFIYGSGGGSAHYSGSTYTMPTYGIVGSETVEFTTYQRNLALDIIEAKSINGSKINKIFEGRVLSKGGCGQIAPIMPHLIGSLFKGFPGKSGDSKRIDLPFNGKC